MPSIIYDCDASTLPGHHDGVQKRILASSRRINFRKIGNETRFLRIFFRRYFISILMTLKQSGCLKGAMRSRAPRSEIPYPDNKKPGKNAGL